MSIRMRPGMGRPRSVLEAQVVRQAKELRAAQDKVTEAQVQVAQAQAMQAQTAKVAMARPKSRSLAEESTSDG
eukprot:3912166-Prymnesium_polylepis.1